MEGFEMEGLESETAIVKNFKSILFIELDDNNMRDQQRSTLILIKY
jgi:hypothetical protein